jgi:hypothetical protein
MVGSSSLSNSPAIGFSINACSVIRSQLSNRLEFAQGLTTQPLPPVQTITLSVNRFACALVLHICRI